MTYASSLRGLAGLTAAALLGAACARNPAVGVPALFGVAAVVALLVVPRHVAWACALLVLVLLPLPQISLTSAVTVSPIFAVPLVLLVRQVAVEPPRLGRLHLKLFAMLAAWLALTVVRSLYVKTSIGWMVYFAVLVVVPALVGSVDSTAREPIERTWAALAGVLGAYAVLEAFVLHSNPLFDALYASTRGTGTAVQQWSVYRATAVFSQPTAAGMFFAVGVPLALGRWLRQPKVAWGLATVASAAGLVATASRAACAGAAIGAVAVTLLPGREPSRTLVPRRVAVLCLLMAAVLAGGWYLASRSGREAANSARFRHAEVPVAQTLVHDNPLGVGVGVAGLSQRATLETNGGAGAFESVWLELAVGAGVPGLLLGAAALFAAVGGAARARAPAIAGALLAWMVSASGYNALEGSRASLLFLGLLLAATFAAAAEREAAPRNARAAVGVGMLPGAVHA